MKKERLNSIELLIVNGLRKMLQLELRKRSPLIPSLSYRKIAYLIIETIRACAKEAEKQYTLQEVLDKFGIKYDTYYDWDEKWHRYLPEWIQKIREK
jgi:hypothetical protein